MRTQTRSVSALPTLSFRLALMVAVLLSVSVLLGCAASATGATPPELRAGEITAVVVTPDASAGQVVDVVFANGTVQDYGFSNCGRLVERRVGNVWVQLPPELRLCIQALDPVIAGGTPTYRVDIPADATPGTYRFVFEMFTQGVDGKVLVPTAPFGVR